MGLLFLHFMTQVGCAIPQVHSLHRIQFYSGPHDAWIFVPVCQFLVDSTLSIHSILLKDSFLLSFCPSLVLPPPLSHPIPFNSLLFCLYHHP